MSLLLSFRTWLDETMPADQAAKLFARAIAHQPDGLFELQRWIGNDPNVAKMLRAALGMADQPTPRREIHTLWARGLSPAQINKLRRKHLVADGEKLLLNVPAAGLGIRQMKLTVDGDLKDVLRSLILWGGLGTRGPETPLVVAKPGVEEPMSVRSIRHLIHAKR